MSKRKIPAEIKLLHRSVNGLPNIRLLVILHLSPLAIIHLTVWHLNGKSSMLIF